MVRFVGVNHLAMATGDMDGTIRFWRDLPGMRLVASLGQKGYRHYFFQISDEELLAFFEWPGVEPVIPARCRLRDLQRALYQLAISVPMRCGWSSCR